MPFTTHDSIYPENEDSLFTAQNGDNDDKLYYDGYDNNDEKEKLTDLMFPYSTKSPPTKVITFMPIDDNEDEGRDEVRYNEKVVSYGIWLSAPITNYEFKIWFNISHKSLMWLNNYIILSINVDV